MSVMGGAALASHRIEKPRALRKRLPAPPASSRCARKSGSSRALNGSSGPGMCRRAGQQRTEHATVALRDGHIAWVRDQLTARSRARCGGQCPPYEILLTRAGQFGRFKTRIPADRCASPLIGTTPWHLGEAGAEAARGQFEPLIQQGEDSLLTRTYREGTRRVKTTTTISALTHLPSAERSRYSAGVGAHKPPFSAVTRIHYLTQTPRAPHVARCRS